MNNKKKVTSTKKKGIELTPEKHVTVITGVQTLDRDKIYILGGIFVLSALVAGLVTCFAYTKAGILKRNFTTKATVEKNTGSDILTSPYIDPYALMTATPSLESQYELIDLRDSESYKKGHIKKSVNIPYTNNIIELTQINKSKHIILYSYTDYSSDGEKVKMYLQKKGYDVSVLKTGWNTFRHFSNIWIPENKWGAVRVDDYIESDNT